MPCRTLSLRWLLTSALIFAPNILAAADSPYFPEAGPAAVHQVTLELGTPAVVLWMALQPGYEDLAGSHIFAWLRERASWSPT